MPTCAEARPGTCPRCIDAHGSGRGSPDDVLSMLTGAVDEEGKGLDDRSLRDQIMTLLVAGHETSATSFCWVFEEILRLPGEQERLLAEAESVFAGAPVATEHLPLLPRIDSVIKEALRLHPVTGAAGRRLKKPATIGGHELRRRCSAWVCVSSWSSRGRT